MTTATPATPTPTKKTAGAKKTTKATVAPPTPAVVESVSVGATEPTVDETTIVEDSTIMDEWLAFEKKNQEWIAAGAALKKELNMLIKKNGREFKSAKKAS